MRMHLADVVRDPHQEQLMAAAPRLGITVEDLRLAWGLDAVRYHLNGESRLVFEGRTYPTLTVAADLICNDKQVTKAYFDLAGVPVPSSRVFTVDARGVEAHALAKELGTFLELGNLYVCKPVYGTDGHAVGMNMRDVADLQAHVNGFAADYGLWMVEEQVDGEDLRIQVIGGKLVAACKRVPAHVVGDGFLSLKELISAHNAKISMQNPKNVLELDDPTWQLMREQNVELDSVIADGRRIWLKLVSNMGQGGLAIDTTDQLHPLYGIWAATLSTVIGIRTFAFDLICRDPSQDPLVHARALELNPRAQWLHHTFSEVRQHDIPVLILQDLFEGKLGS